MLRRVVKIVRRPACEHAEFQPGGVGGLRR
jgi:hypothetical protein